jgi:hypothetical protein
MCVWSNRQSGLHRADAVKYNSQYYARQPGNIKGETVMANKEQKSSKEKKKPKKDGKKSGSKAQG